MRRAFVGLLVLTAACVPIRRAPSAAELTRAEWARTLDDARAAAEGGRHDEVDKLLAAFATQHPGTPQATETLYWRGLYRLDPANRSHTAHEALQMLDAYLAARTADSVQHPFHDEALVLRRTAAQVEQLGRALSAANAASATRPTAPPPDPKPSDIAARDEEIARLRAELAKATDELNRIKRRLSTRRP